MGDIRNRNLRFNLEELEQRKAWEYLQQMDKKKLGSQNQLIVRSINEFFERYYSLEEDPFLETREKEENFMTRIVEGVVRGTKEQMPNLVSAYMMQVVGQMIQGTQAGTNITIPIVETVESKDDTLTHLEAESEMIDNPDLDWEFLG